MRLRIFRRLMKMEAKEVKKWQDEEALKRYGMIVPLLDPELDEGKRRQMREEAAERNGISKRTLYRYEKGCREEGFEGLRPAGRTKKRRQGLSENFERIMEQAVQLKREVPKRSVRQIIKILELEFSFCLHRKKKPGSLFSGFRDKMEVKNIFSKSLYKTYMPNKSQPSNQTLIAQFQQ